MAVLVDDVFKGNLTSIRASAELRNWADRYGLSPKAAQALRWKLENDEPVPEGASPLPQHGTSEEARRERLRVVDREGAA